MSAAQHLERLEARIEGYVQGVGFRWFVAREAARLGLVGWVANEADGSLRVVVEGSSDALDDLLIGLHRGPSAAEVRRVISQRLAAAGRFGGFEIRAGGHSGD
jgi:acylphosphatase